MVEIEEALTASDDKVADEGPFARLYREQYAHMVRVAFLLTGSNAVAEDLVQDAFVRIHGRVERLEGPSEYLRRAVVNGCRSWHRRRRVEWRLRPDPPREVDPPEIDESWELLRRLSPRRRAAIVLRYYVGSPDEEIARVLGCSEANVRSLVHRGLMQLRQVVSR